MSTLAPVCKGQKSPMVVMVEQYKSPGTQKVTSKPAVSTGSGKQLLHIIVMYLKPFSTVLSFFTNIKVVC